MDVMKKYLELQDKQAALKICKHTVRRRRLLKESFLLGLEIAEELGLDLDTIIRGDE